MRQSNEISQENGQKSQSSFVSKVQPLLDDLRADVVSKDQSVRCEMRNFQDEVRHKLSVIDDCINYFDFWMDTHDGVERDKDDPSHKVVPLVKADASKYEEVIEKLMDFDQRFEAVEKFMEEFKLREERGDISASFTTAQEAQPKTAPEAQPKIRGRPKLSDEERRSRKREQERIKREKNIAMGLTYDGKPRKLIKVEETTPPLALGKA